MKCLLLLLGLGLVSYGMGEGNFRAGAMSWRQLQGNEIELRLQSEWRRSFTGYTGNFSLNETTRAVIGDVVEISGQETPYIFWGDGTFSVIRLIVDTYSVDEDWMRGTTILTHDYPTPLDPSLSPWKVNFTGCCRDNRTVNNIGRAWTLVATVDVTTSKGLPQISSPLLLTITSTSSVNAPGTCAMPASFGSIGPCTVIRLSTTCGVDFTGEFLLEPDCQGGSTFTQPRLGTQATCQSSTSTNTWLQLFRDGTLQLTCAGNCPAFALYSFRFRMQEGSLYTQAELLVKIQQKQTCESISYGSQCLPGVTFSGIPSPSFIPNTFPGNGLQYDEQTQALVQAKTTVSGDDGNIIAYSGYPVHLSFNITNNWCQNDTGALVNDWQDPTCLTHDDVLIEYGTLPRANISFSSVQEDSIIDLLVTFENPLEVATPGQDFPISYAARQYFNTTAAASQAVARGFVKINQNLNEGAGGAGVFLWYKKFDPSLPRWSQPAISDIKISDSPEQEALLSLLGYQKVDGNLNEGTSGRKTFLWYRKNSGVMQYDQEVARQKGLRRGIVEIRIESSTTYPAFIPPTTDWEQVVGNLNSGTGSLSVLSFFVRRHNREIFETFVTWTPCSCDVGTRRICATPVLNGTVPRTDLRVRGSSRCVAVHVIPANLPTFILPSPSAMANIVHYISNQTSTKFGISTFAAWQQVEWQMVNAPSEMTMSAEQVSQCETSSQGQVGCRQRFRNVMWTPSWRDGGSNRTVCVRVYPVKTGCEIANQDFSELCFIAYVPRCLHAIQSGQHLQEIAALYGTSWLDLFSLNPTIRTPDKILDSQQIINIGNFNITLPDGFSLLNNKDIFTPSSPAIPSLG